MTPAHPPIFAPGLPYEALVHQATYARAVVIDTLLALLSAATDPGERRQLVTTLLRATSAPILAARQSSRPDPAAQDTAHDDRGPATTPSLRLAAVRAAPTPPPAPPKPADRPRPAFAVPHATAAQPHPTAQTTPTPGRAATTSTDPPQDLSASTLTPFPARRSPPPRAASITARAGAATHPP